MFALAALGSWGCAAPPGLLDRDAQTGFAVYRSGRLGQRELQGLCRVGVDEIAVLAGSARRRECRWRTGACAELRVRYDEPQRAASPLDADFLAAFDGWVEQSQREGRAIAFRCRHGWHRAGRLAAYYRMRFQGWSVEEATAEMLEVGRFMARHPYLVPQVRALADHIAGEPCSTAPEHCVRAGSGQRELASDACGSEPP